MDNSELINTLKDMRKLDSILSNLVELISDRILSDKDENYINESDES